MINNVLLLVIFLSLNVFAQRTETEILKLLNDGSEKVWLYEGTETFMKGSDHCDEGKYFLFRSDNKVVIAECINLHPQKRDLCRLVHHHRRRGILSGNNRNSRL
jgi:hypothetical protein